MQNVLRISCIELSQMRLDDDHDTEDADADDDETFGQEALHG